MYLIRPVIAYKTLPKDLQKEAWLKVPFDLHKIEYLSEKVSMRMAPGSNVDEWDKQHTSLHFVKGCNEK